MSSLTFEGNNPLMCKMCRKIFGTIQALERHHKRKIPCNRILKCMDCGKVFKQISHLKRHKNRKTSCKFIHGDPTIRVDEKTCIYCRKIFKSKYNVKKHHNVCKIKNGGMNILFDEVKRLKQKVKELEKKQTTQVNNITNNITNHFGHTFNFNFINFGKGEKTIKEILNTKGIKTLEQKFTRDLPMVKQISDKVVNLVGLVFRNPEYKELQGIYVLDPSKTKENAYYQDNGDWVLTDWKILRSQILQKLYNCLSDSKEHKKRDIENIIKYIFVLSECGDCRLIKKLTKEETSHIYENIAGSLHFDTITR